jgi:hypothetical protein
VPNPFDQFDAPSAPNPFDQFDEAAPQQAPKRNSFGDFLRNEARGYGVNTRTVLEAGMDLVSPFADALSLGVNKVLPGNPLPSNHSQSFSQLLTRAGLPEPATDAERFSNVASRAIMGFASGGPLSNTVIKGVDALKGVDVIKGGYGLANVPNVARTAQEPSRQVLAAAQKEGLVVPPAQVKPYSAGSFLEGMGGTLKTGQLSAAKNQPIIDSIAARAVGVPDEALSPELLQSIRTQATPAYRVIRGAGNVVTDDDFVKQVANAAKPFRAEGRTFQSLANKGLTDIADDISKPSFDADEAVDAIEMLRDKASVAFRAGSNKEGGAYRSMASALESSIERHLEKTGKAGSEILKAFRSARQLIAKTHTVEDALKGSHVDIAALGRMLKNGVPLTDELKMLAQFSQNFPGAANLTQALKARPAYSPLDAVTGLSSMAGAAATGNPMVATPAAYAIGRPAARHLALSPMLQRGLTKPPGRIPWAGLIGSSPAGVNAMVGEEEYGQ